MWFTSLLGMGGGGSKKSSEKSPDPYQPPPYVPSEYDAGSAKSIYGFYEPRTRGESLGYGKDDLNLLETQAQDHSTRNMNEAIRRGGMARRRGTQGTYSGGRDVMRDESIRAGLEYRSNAMRDIAVRNAVQKHSDQWGAASGLGTFLNNERAHALAKWSGNMNNAQQAYNFNEIYPATINQEQEAAQNEQSGQNMKNLLTTALNLYSAYKTNSGTGGNNFRR